MGSWLFPSGGGGGGPNFSSGGSLISSLAGNPLVSLGLQAFGVIKAFQLLVDITMAVARTLKDFGDEAVRTGAELIAMRVQSGGTFGESMQLRAFGISGGQSRALGDRIASDPFAAMYALRFGAYAVPGPYGTLDNAANTLRIIEGVRKMQGTEQLRAIRTLGLEDQTPLIRARDDTFERLRIDAQDQARVLSPEFEKDMNELLVQRKRFFDSWSLFKTNIGKIFLPTVTDFFRTMADTFYTVTGATSGLGDIGQNGLSPFGIGKTLGHKLAHALGLGGSGEAQGQGRLAGANAAMNENTAELSRNTMALQRVTHMLGGGDRARSALPPALMGPRGRGQALVDAYRSGTLRLGNL
jgi:hypothetical protein